MKLLRNLRRAAFARGGTKSPRCPVCRLRVELMPERPGSASPGSLEADHALSGCCSRDCAATYYRLRDADGAPICVCGAVVEIPLGDCLVCRVSLRTMEDGALIHSDCLV